MPFTFAHPMYAAPLKVLKPQYISLTGIILGSMAPDFEYFIALEPFQSIGHSLEGLFIQGIPISIMLAFVFHYLIKIPLADNLSSLFQLDAKANGIIQEWKLDKLRSWIIFIISVIAGFYSHVLLDAFTHKSGLMVTRYTFLQGHMVGIPIYKILQHTLSIVGLLLQGIILLRILNKGQGSNNYVSVKTRVKIKYWAVVFLVTLSTIALKLIFTSSTNLVGILVVSSISGFFIGIVISSTLYKIKQADTG
ncbi:DUF4184 family protein [Paenibacillus sp. FA6]|uniref:DUF4184 family protein n=1 Tax=Paenibacillus sp. FA6 TaxID=3413029 RepID=UPI003F658C55